MLKKEWNKEDFRNAELSIKKFLNSRPFASNKSKNVLYSLKALNSMDMIARFAYTSSGEYAGYFISNIRLFLDKDKKFEIYGFCIDTDNIVYAHCWDINDNNNELYIRI